MAIRQTWRSSAKFRVGLTITILLFATALLADPLTRLVIGDRDPLATGSYGVFEDPSREHPFGTDRFGRDVFGLVLVGLPNSLIVAAIGGGSSQAAGAAPGVQPGLKSR